VYMGDDTILEATAKGVLELLFVLNSQRRWMC
jgi:hypothetical protein